MTFSVANQAMLGIFPAGDSPLTKLNKTFFDNVQEDLADVDGSCFQSKFQSTRNNLEKVRLFSKYFDDSSSTVSNGSPYSKCPSTSTELRDRSNTYYRQKHFQRALRGYNLAIVFAPVGTSELSLALGNRSAVFLELGYHEECLRDIEMALKNGYPEDLKAKLEERRLKCVTTKQNDFHASESSDFSKLKEFRENKLFKLISPNPMMPAAEDYITISTHKDRGRELITRKEVPVGTVLIVETPYVKLLKNELTFEVEHCHNCLKNTLDGIPCSGCVFAMYCSEKCRQAAWEQYHQYECPCMTLLHLNKTPRYAQLAFRIICTLGPEKTLELYKSRQKSDRVMTPVNGLPGEDRETGIYSSTLYEPIHHLVSNSESHSDLDKFSNTMQSLVLVTCLERYTNFFQNIMESEEFRTWLASLILHHLQNVPCNSISLDELKESNSDCSKLANKASVLTPTELAEKMRILQFDQYASGTYGVISLINHSCDPNVTRVNDLVDGRMAIVALKGLKPGEPLTTSYTKVFLSDSLDERREYLRANYYFTCQCKPCVENWPILAQLSAQEPKFICISCSVFPNIQITLDSKGNCSKCGGSSGQSKKRLADYIKFVEKFYQSYQLVLQNKPIDSINKLLPCLEYFHSKLGSPYSKTYMAQDVLKRALDLIVYFSNFEN